MKYLCIIASFVFSLARSIIHGATNETATVGNAYEGIAIHNIFNLKPAIATAAGISPTVAPPQITLTGIMTILGPAQAVFKVKTSSRTGLAAENSYVLAEGQSRDGIAVQSIDYEAESVTFDNHGLLQNISLANATNLTAIIFTSDQPAAKIDSHPPDFERSRLPDYLGGGSDPVPSGEPFRSKTLDERILMIEAQRAYYKGQNDPRADLLPATAMTPATETETDNEPVP